MALEASVQLAGGDGSFIRLKRGQSAGLDLTSQLAFQYLKKSFPEQCLIVCPSEHAQGLVCPVCGNGHPKLLANVGCDHFACEDCWLQNAKDRVSRCCDQQGRGVSCFDPACDCGMSPGLLQQVGQQSETVGKFASRVSAERRRLERTAKSLLVWGGSVEAGPVCGYCDKPQFALLCNEPCGHNACEECLLQVVDKAIDHSRAECLTTIRTRCPDPTCKTCIAADLEKHICTISKSLQQYNRDMVSEATRLKRTGGAALVWASPEAELGLVCRMCDQKALALLSNEHCGHQACEDCWAKWAEKQVPRCRTDKLAQIYGPCLSPDCAVSMSPLLETHSCTRSSTARKFREEMDAEVKRLAKFAGQVLVYGETPTQRGPECSICRDRCLALLANPDCGHTACEDCWANWSATQIDMCRANKRMSATCFAPSCRLGLTTCLWEHGCTRNEAVNKFNVELVRRRKLQSNVLYPAAVQVDCPQAGCLGLGYQGYDTIMCFACEHQWTFDDTAAAPPTDLDVELIGNEVMKKCPSCGEHIIKNGGCDHMTCRCRHEFYWTTLLPYGTDGR